MKDKLIELIKESVGGRATYWASWASHIADHLIANGVTVRQWIPANEPPKKYRDEYGELIPFLVCEYGTEKPFRAVYDGREWGDGCFAIMVTHWMPLPEPPKEEA